MISTRAKADLLVQLDRLSSGWSIDRVSAKPYIAISGVADDPREASLG